MSTDTKEALLEVAETAVRRQGYDGFSYADLAEAVGIRKASIHHHFPTKAVLAVALMERYHARTQAHLAEIGALHATGAKRLSALIDYYREASNEGRQLCLCVALSSHPDTLSDALRAAIVAYRRMITRWLESAFVLAQEDGTLRASAPEDEAPALLAQLEGGQLAARAAGDPYAFDDALNLFFSRVF